MDGIGSALGSTGQSALWSAGAPPSGPGSGVTYLPPTPAMVRTAEVEDELAEVCGVLNAAHARLVALVSAALAEGLWQQSGIASPAHWLRWKAGLGPTQSEALVRLARRLEPLPVTSAAFARGELSVDQATVIARHVPPTHDAAAAGLARQLMVPQLATALRRHAYEPDDETPAAAAPAPDSPAAPADPPPWPRRSRLSLHPDDEGWYRLSGRLEAEDGAALSQVLETERARLFRQRQQETADGSPTEVTLADALRQVVDLAAGNCEQPRAVRDRYKVLVHADLEDLDDPTSRLRLHLGPLLGAPASQRITCDADFQLLLRRRGLAVAFGPTVPSIPERIRRLIEARDQHCRFPGCRRRWGLEVHHLVPRAEGGWTIEANLACLCTTHHHQHHRGEFTITGDPTSPTGLCFTTRDGVVLAGPAPPKPGGEVPVGRWEHPPGHRLDWRWLTLAPDRPPIDAPGGAS